MNHNLQTHESKHVDPHIQRIKVAEKGLWINIKTPLLLKKFHMLNVL